MGHYSSKATGVLQALQVALVELYRDGRPVYYCNVSKDYRAASL